MIEAILNSYSQAGRGRGPAGLPSKTSCCLPEKRDFFETITDSRYSRQAARSRNSQSRSSPKHWWLAMFFCLGPTPLTESKWSSFDDKCAKAGSIGILQER